MWFKEQWQKTISYFNINTRTQMYPPILVWIIVILFAGWFIWFRG
jgi:hypothetical protein